MELALLCLPVALPSSLMTMSIFSCHIFQGRARRLERFTRETVPALGLAGVLSQLGPPLQLLTQAPR